MLIWAKDSLFFNIDKNLSKENFHSITPSVFEKIYIKDINEDILQIEYQWIDSIKISDKIYSNKAKNIICWFFNQKNIIVFFSNSQSEVSYIKNKLEKNLKATFSVLEIYNQWKKAYITQSQWFCDLITIHIKNEIVPYDEDETIKVHINDKKHDEIKDILTKKTDLISSLTFSCNHKFSYFYLDPESVISFPETINIESIIFVLNGVLNEI
ncbi:hypothetical protein [Alkalihalobacterium alkalinitrilicum]|uniref:hypothetical protein n=1 Tax=Alkalihalobacterium alkalinitrilicum TaxID=427920 RepID=UPI000995D1D4|nr:hypothetical protein [Alkalihalobacterium alkalinitrilicum]